MRGSLVAVVALVSCACSVLPGSAPAPTATPPPAAAPAAAASPSPPVATATTAAAPKPANTAAPSGNANANANTVYVGNTDGEGVYLRKTPTMNDKLQAYPDGTALTIVGEDVENEDQTWKHVKAPDGTEGYVPAMYTTDTPP